MPSQKYDMNNSFRIIFIIRSIVKVNIVKACSKNSYSITRKYGITRIFNKVEYLIICVRSIKKFLIVLLVRNQSGTNFDAARQSLTASSHIFWVLYWSVKKIDKRSSKINLHTFREFYIDHEHKEMQENIYLML